MSREIDMSQGLENLSKEDLIYLRERGRLTPEQERSLLGGIETTAPTAPNMEEQPNTGTIAGGAPDTSGAADSPDGNTVTAPYSRYKNAELEAEIERRNSARPEEDQIAPEGTTKEDLVNALDEDDEEQAE